MKVEQCIVEKVTDPETGQPKFQITTRVHLACELLEPAEQPFVRVRLLEAGAGLAIGAQIVVPAAKLLPD